MDFEFTVLDNGDDRVCVDFKLDRQKSIMILCPMFMPITSLGTSVMVAGAGH